MDAAVSETPSLRVLLLHEYSGVHTYLRAGLRALGVAADIATYGDLSKRFSTDIFLGRAVPGPAAAVSRALRQRALVPRFRSYDVIQTISASPFFRPLAAVLEAAVLGRGPRFVYVAAGSDSVYLDHARQLAYWPPLSSWGTPRQARRERRTLRRTHAIVSAAWDYHWVYEQAGIPTQFIPFPVDVESIVPSYAGHGQHLTVYHPINRVEGNDFKGTSHVRRAFETLRREFPDVRFVEKGRMSFSEYVEFTKSIDVLVDQTNSYSYGMAATLGMAQGKVVLSGREPRTDNLPMYAESPILNIVPDPEQIAETLRRLLVDRQRIQALGAASRRFAETHHRHTTVAQTYLELYRSLLDRRR